MSPGDVARRLNRGLRSRNARVTAGLEHAFGTDLVVRQYWLGNGLEVLLLPDPSAPVVSYQTWFRVGSRHEKKGKTGLAHLFEHLMFKGTSNVPHGHFDRLLEAAGGDTNAATWTDWTYYYENVPSSELELAVRLEADRMANLVLNAEQVASEKEVVANERRYRVDDDVEGAVNERLYANAFRKHPYGWPTIGWMKDIEGFTLADCRAFYRTFYAPNNALVVVAGDVDEVEALSTLQEHYGRLGPSRLPVERRVKEPAQRRERSLEMRLPTQTEKLELGYHAPGFSHFDYAVIVVADEILTGGRSSRLYRELVSEGELASEVSGSIAPFRDPGLYELWVDMREGRKTGEALRLVERAIKRLAESPVGDSELEKAKSRLELSHVSGMETASGKAEQVGFCALVMDEPAGAFQRLADYQRVSTEDIRRVASRWLKRSARTRIRVRPQNGRSRS